jgi:hypothetical protein
MTATRKVANARCSFLSISNSSPRSPEDFIEIITAHPPRFSQEPTEGLGRTARSERVFFLTRNSMLRSVLEKCKLLRPDIEKSVVFRGDTQALRWRSEGPTMLWCPTIVSIRSVQEAVVRVTELMCLRKASATNLCDEHYEKMRTNDPEAVDWLIDLFRH